MKTHLITFLFISLTSSAVFSQNERVFKDTIYNANFEDTILYSADFTDVLFKGSANFRNTQFLSEADFSGSQFDSLVDFSHAKFKNNALFSYVHFRSETNFYNTIFDSLTVFTEAKFEFNVIFSRAIFFSKVIFAYSEFKGEMKLNFATLPDIILFDFVKQMAYEVDFTNVYLPDTQPICYISLIDTDISKIKLKYSQFQLSFPNISKIVLLAKIQKDYDHDQKTNVYEQLLKVQKEHGFTESYEKLDKEYQKFKYTDDKEGLAFMLGHIFNFAQKHWWGYGYDKELVIRNTFILLILFTLTNYRLFHFMNERVYKIENVWAAYQERETAHRQRNRVNKDKEKILSGLSFNLNKWVYTFYYTSLVFFGLKLSIENINYNHRGGVAYLFFQYTVGLICLAYIANFIILS